MATLRTVLKIPRPIAAAAVLALSATMVVAAGGAAPGNAERVNVKVDCHCPDAVGKDFCSAFKKKVGDSVGYRLVENASDFGIGVHFSCVDMWQGINDQLAGRMSAVSVAFTIYSDKLPGEVFEDSSVFRVGKDAVPDMTTEVLTALGQLVSMNSSFFDRMRTAARQPSPAPSPRD